MSVSQTILSTLQETPVAACSALTLLLAIGYYIYYAHLHPLSHIPGPLLPKITSLWLYYHSYIGDEASVIFALHEQYGPLLRVAPNHVDISDADAVQPIYVTNGGFLKAECYSNFDIDGHATIFSAKDLAYRAVRAKKVVPMFSAASIRTNVPAMYDCVDRMILRMREAAGSGLPVNILNLTRSLAIDIVSLHLFQLNYNGTEERSEKLSVGAYVDSLVGVGRFFYVPTWAFLWLEWASDKLTPNEEAHKSMDIVENFIDDLVENTPRGSQNYPDRLTELGLQTTEVKSQCKDLVFAGTDSTGMNIATFCRFMALNPQRYEKLYQELQANKRSPHPTEIQALPYLTATIKELLRLSLANPTRLPRVVPPTGWLFNPTTTTTGPSPPSTTTFFPPGSIVGCSAFQLHHNATAFPAPRVFNPERWLIDDNAEETERSITTSAGEEGEDKDVRETATTTTTTTTTTKIATMNKRWFPFGAGPRACIARNLAMTELYLAVERIVESRVLDGAGVVKVKLKEKDEKDETDEKDEKEKEEKEEEDEGIEIFEWFNSRVRGECIELVWKGEGGEASIRE